MNPVTVQQGTSPIILGQPHCGTYLPDDVLGQLNENGRQLLDTDWHVDQLYDGVFESASIVRANFHRYVIDANRDPSGQSLYPGQNTTGLVPVIDFENNPIWRVDPTPEQIEKRRAQFHAAYHDALAKEVDRVKAIHGIAVVYDCHSIRSALPFLFDGVLPDLNIGTNNGTTCSAALERAVNQICAASNQFSSVLNGRFKGGWTTRHYGKPKSGVHAIQMEIAQSCYLSSEVPPFEFDPTKAMSLRAILEKILRQIDELARHTALEETAND